VRKTHYVLEIFESVREKTHTIY